MSKAWQLAFNTRHSQSQTDLTAVTQRQTATQNSLMDALKDLAAKQVDQRRLQDQCNLQQAQTANALDSAKTARDKANACSGEIADVKSKLRWLPWPFNGPLTDLLTELGARLIGLRGQADEMDRTARARASEAEATQKILVTLQQQLGAANQEVQNLEATSVSLQREYEGCAEIVQRSNLLIDKVVAPTVSIDPYRCVQVCMM